MNKFYILWIVIWIGVAFALAEASLQNGVFPISFDMANVKYIFDSDSLYKIKPGSRPDIDKNGYRFNHMNDASITSHNVIMSGDSFLFAANVASNETIAAQLDDNLGADYSVSNMGVPGYGPDQSLELLKDNADINHSDLIILTIFPANDFNDLVKNKIYLPSIRDRSISLSDETTLDFYLPNIWFSMLVTDISNEQWFVELTTTLFADRYDLGLLRDIKSMPSRQKIDLMTGVIKGFSDIANLHEMGLVVVILPSFEQFNNTGFFANNGIKKDHWFVAEDAVFDICHTNGIHAINLHHRFQNHQDPMSLYDPLDHHFSSDGYKFVAQEIANYIKGNNLLLSNANQKRN